MKSLFSRNNKQLEDRYILNNIVMYVCVSKGQNELFDS